MLGDALGRQLHEPDVPQLGEHVVLEHRAVGDHRGRGAARVGLERGQPRLRPLPQGQCLDLDPHRLGLPFRSPQRRGHEGASRDIRLGDVQGRLGVGDGLEDPERLGRALVVHPDPVAAPEPGDATRQAGPRVLRAHVIPLRVEPGCVSPVSVFLPS